MSKTKKKIAQIVLVVMIVSLFSVQTAATWTSLRTFNIPRGQITVGFCQGGWRLEQRTAAIPQWHIRHVRINSQNQSMSSNPQVRVFRLLNHINDATWMIDWRPIANNATLVNNIPYQANRVWRVEVRSAANQIVAGTARFRLCVNTSTLPR